MSPGTLGRPRAGSRGMGCGRRLVMRDEERRNPRQQTIRLPRSYELKQRRRDPVSRVNVAGAFHSASASLDPRGLNAADSPIMEMHDSFPGAFTVLEPLKHGTTFPRRSFLITLFRPTFLWSMPAGIAIRRSRQTRNISRALSAAHSQVRPILILCSVSCSEHTPQAS